MSLADEPRLLSCFAGGFCSTAEGVGRGMGSEGSTWGNCAAGLGWTEGQVAAGGACGDFNIAVEQRRLGKSPVRLCHALTLFAAELPGGGAGSAPPLVLSMC